MAPSIQRFLSTLLALVLLGSCVDGDAPLGLAGGRVLLDLPLQASLILASQEDAARPVNRIRARAERVPDGAVLGSTVLDVSPTASSWDIGLDVAVEGTDVQVVVYLELIHVDASGAETVEFSGRTAPISVQPGVTSQPASVEVVKGPLGNFSVTGIRITEAPATLLEGDRANLSAQVSTDGSGGSFTVFWLALDPALASLSGTTVEGLLPGVAQVVATAGLHADTAAITILPRAAEVVVVPDQVAVVGPGAVAAFLARVLDGRGEEIPGAEVAWRTLTPEILRSLGGGRFESLAVGDGVVEAVAVADTTLRAQGVVRVDPHPADLRVTKLSSRPSVLEGEEVVFTLGVRNVGGVAVGGVAVVDSLPEGLELMGAVPDVGSFHGGTGRWEVGAMAPGATASLVLTARAVVGAGGQTLVNVARVTPGEGFQDSNPSNDRATASVAVLRPTADLSVLKEADRTLAAEGDTLTFTVAVRNAGPFDTDRVQVVDALPPGLRFLDGTFSAGSFDPGTLTWDLPLVAGGSATLALQVEVEAGYAGRTLVNTARITGTGSVEDPAPANNESSASLEVLSSQEQADVGVAKTVDRPTAAVGDTVVFTMTIVNHGPADATNVQVFDTLPTGLDSLELVVPPGVVPIAFGQFRADTLRVGDTLVATLRALVGPEGAGGTVLNRILRLSQDQVDPNDSNDLAVAGVAVAAAPIDIAVLKSALPATVVETDTVTFTVRVVNTGSVEATNVVVRDLLATPFDTVVSVTTELGAYVPATGIWTIPAVAAGDTVDLVLAVLVTDRSGGTTPANQAYLVSLDQGDTYAANDTATVTVTVDRRPLDLEIQKTVDNPLPLEGSQVQYRVTVINHGPGTATAVTVADTVPTGMAADSIRPSAGTVGGHQWTIPSLAPADSAVLTTYATVQTGFAGTSITNRAGLLSLDQRDSIPANDADSVTVYVPLSTPPVVTIAAPAEGATFDPGDTIQFTAAASDAEDGDLTATIAWTSNRNGAIGTGGSFSSFTLSPGPHTIAATVTDGTGTVRADTVHIVLAIVGTPTALNVPFGGTASLPISLSAPAPAGGLALTVLSGSPGIANPTSMSLVIPAGALSANATIQGILPGMTTVSVTSVGYGSDMTTVSVTASLNILEGSVTFPRTYTGTLNVRLESQGIPIAAPAGGLSVSLSPADATCATVPSPVTIPAGLVQTNATVSYGGSAAAPCATTITATAPSVVSDATTVYINPQPGITIYGGTVGRGLQTSTSVTLGWAQHGGVTVRLESSNPSVLLVSPNATTPGTAFIDVPLANGVGSFTYYVQGVEGVAVPDTLPVTATAPGFTAGSGNWVVEQAMLALVSLNATTTTFTADDPFQVYVGISDLYYGGVSSQNIRAGGAAVTATITSADPAVGQLTTSLGSGGTATVTIPVGFSYSPSSVAAGGAALDPLTAGTTTVSATIPGFAQRPNATVPVTVSAPGITVYAGRVGSGLQTSYSVYLGASEHGGVTVRVESADPASLLVSPNATMPGTAFIDVPLANGVGSFTYHVQGVEGVAVPDTVPVTATAPGFTAGSGNWVVEQAMYSISGLASNQTTFSPDDPFQVYVGVSDVYYGGVTSQNVRAGGTARTVTLTSSVSAVGQFTTSLGTGGTATVTIPVGLSYSPASVAAGGVAFDPLTAGNTTVTAAIPGFAPRPNATVAMTVSAPGITMATGTVGAGLQSATSLSLGASQHGGVTVRITSSAPSVLQVSPNATTAGTTFIDVVVPNGTAYVSFHVQGVEGTTGTATVTATAAGFTDGTASWTVVQPMFAIVGLGSTFGAAAADDPFQVHVGISDLYYSGVTVQPIRAGGTAVTATITSSAPAVGQLTTLAGSAAARTVQILAGGYSSPTSVALGGVAFDPLTAGNTTVSAAIPGFLQRPNAVVPIVINP